MILKTLTHRGAKGDCDCWNFYDNVETASVYFNEDIEETCIDIRFASAREDITLAVTDDMYLCNDEGRTIEKFRPATRSTPIE